MHKLQPLNTETTLGFLGVEADIECRFRAMKQTLCQDSAGKGEHNGLRFIETRTGVEIQFRTAALLFPMLQYIDSIPTRLQSTMTIEAHQKVRIFTMGFPMVIRLKVATDLVKRHKLTINFIQRD